MQTIYSAEFMQDNCACYSKEKVKLEKYLKGRKKISYLDIIESDIPLKDKYWFFCKKVFTQEQNQRISLIVAEIVLPLYEEKYPDNKAPREAIEATKLYIKGEITSEQLLIKRRAAINAAAYAAADADADAYYAAAATYAAAAAAYYAADYAAYAAAAAYYAAAAVDAAVDAAASSDDSYKQKLEKALMDFIESN